MSAAVELRTDYSIDELRRLAKGSKDANQSRRLLSLAAVLEGMNRADAARIGGMDRQTLRDWSIGSTRTVLMACAIPGRAGQRHASRPPKKPNSPTWSKRVLTGKSMVSCDGGASISSASSPRVSASIITSAMSERC